MERAVEEGISLLLDRGKAVAPGDQFGGDAGTGAGQIFSRILEGKAGHTPGLTQESTQVKAGAGPTDADQAGPLLR